MIFRPLLVGYKTVRVRRLRLSLLVNVNIDLIVSIPERHHSAESTSYSVLAAFQFSNIFDEFLIETSCQRFVFHLVLRCAEHAPVSVTQSFIEGIIFVRSLTLEPPAEIYALILCVPVLLAVDISRFRFASLQSCVRLTDFH